MQPTSNLFSLFAFFSEMGERYISSYLRSGWLDFDRMRVDRLYGLQAFLANWAYERSGAPRGLRIAAVKAVSFAGEDLADVAKVYDEIFGGKPNRQNNPALDSKLANLDIPAVIQQVQSGELRKAYDALKLKGVGPKIRTFFIRDVVTLAQCEGQITNNADFVYCQPIDVWVRFAVTCLRLPDTPPELWNAGTAPPGFNRDDLQTAAKLNMASFATNVSPLRVNQGIWYYCANVIADEARLKDLLSPPDVNALRNELTAMNGFVP